MFSRGFFLLRESTFLRWDQTEDKENMEGFLGDYNGP